MMQELITLDQAKQHLRIVGSHEDADLQMKIEQAQALVLDYLRQRINPPARTGTTASFWPNTLNGCLNPCFQQPALPSSGSPGSPAEPMPTPLELWSAEIDSWDEDTVPKQVQAAILVQLGELFRYRGDDADLPAREMGTLHPQAVSYLYRLRDPALA